MNHNWLDWYLAFGPSTWSNWALALFASGATLIALRTLKAIRKQAQIANDTLILSNRPRIKVRRFVIKPWNEFWWELPIAIECQVVNAGGTDAFIVESNCTISARREAPDALPMLPPYSDQLDSFKIKEGVLPAGLALMYQSSTTILHSRHDDLVAQGQINLYAFGYISYKDQRGNLYRTGFCRRYNYSKKRFEIVENPDYEHTD